MTHHWPWLSAIILLPLLGSGAALAAARRPALCRGLTLGVALAELALVASLFCLGLKPQAGPAGTWLLAEDYPWIERLGARLSLGLDGVSLMLILLTAFLIVLSVLISWRAINARVGSFHFFLLFMEASIMGVFLATDLFLFYLFWEIQLIPMFFLVGVWGHEKRVHAAVKFLLFTLGGSLFMLLALIGLYWLHGTQTGVYTFSLYHLVSTPVTGSLQVWLFAAFLLAFAIKIPVIPVHTWLPDTHTEAPTAGSVILAGLLLKTGAYALLRFAFPLFPEAARSAVPLLLVLGLAGAFYAAWIALAQTDLKRLVAYSSIGHMGYIVIGLAIGNLLTMSGALLQMVNHGLSTGALFILVGMLDERLNSRQLSDMGGLWGRMPVFSAFFLLFALSSLGLPGLNNFVGEMLILLGTFKARPLVAILGFAGLVFTVIYILRMVQEALFGEARKEQEVWDLTPREMVILGALAAAILFIGLHPGPVLKVLEPAVQGLVSQDAQVALIGW
jgi:NADH-quinone oxidoreductase subunit M